MKRPNFFIVGAPKSGTTALSEYLRGHPNVFLCEPKEPHFFSSDFSDHQYVRNESGYLSLFSFASNKQYRIGEASVGYLYSRTALPAIRRFSPDAKIIAMVRNPVAMAVSWHRQLLYARFEDVPDFETAWRLQDERRTSPRLPATCRAPAFLQYAEICRVGAQVQRLYAIFPPEQIKVLLFDDFIANTRHAYREVLDFLGLPDDQRTHFPRINEAKEIRSAVVAAMIVRAKPLAVQVAAWLRAYGKLNLFPFLQRMEKLNQVSAEKNPIRRALCEEMSMTFREDIELLGRIVGRDLSAWHSVCESLSE